MGCEKLSHHNPDAALSDGELPVPGKIIDQANRLREIGLGDLSPLELIKISAGLVEARNSSKQKVAVLAK
ncbi:MAG: hypothetical protein Q8P26_00490 [Candidatus Levybacteria bacterium]|nr:hypothetical protein [Candidatus Levybacteria bacterium]MDZ4228130.1 hypothetical protein [Candidatus Levybacteria bacterium]